MVYESDFYTVRRPYSRPTITSYSVTGCRPCLSMRNVIPPAGTHSKVRMSVLLGELNRIQNRHRPHFACVPTEDYLCSRALVDFDDEAKHIRAAADKLIRYVHTSVPHETSRLPIRVITAYDRYAPEGRFVSKYSTDIPTNIQCMSYYTEPSRVTIGRGHLACVSYAGGRGYPRRKHLYSDENRDIGDEIKFRSYYSRNVHPSRNDDALLLPTGFASRILLPDRRLLPTDEGRALVFQSKLVKPISSGLTIRKEKPDKSATKVPKQKSRAQAIEDAILAEEGTRVAASKPQPQAEVVPTKEESPEPAPIVQPARVVEPAPEPELETPREPTPPPVREPTPPPVETKTKAKKEVKKKSSIKSSAPVAEVDVPQEPSLPVLEPAPITEPPSTEEIIRVDEVQPTESNTESGPTSTAEPGLKEIASEEPVEEQPVQIELPQEPSVEEEFTPVEPALSQPDEDAPETVEDIKRVCEEEMPAESNIESMADLEVPSEPPCASEPEVIEEDVTSAVEAIPSQECEPEVEIEDTAAPIVETESVVVEQKTVAAADEEIVDDTAAPVPSDEPSIALEETEPQREEESVDHDPSSRLEGAPDAEPSEYNPVAEVRTEDTLVDLSAQESNQADSGELDPQDPTTEEAQSPEIVESPSSEILSETTEVIIEEPTTPNEEQ